MDNTFGQSLAAARQAKGLSQSELAERLCISRQAVSNWERGKSYPDLDTLKLIAEALDTSTSRLLQEKTGDGLKISLWPTLVCLAATAVHLVLGILGYVNWMAVLTLPCMACFMMLIVVLSFRAMFRSGNYDMLAGFDSRKDSVPKTRLQMYWLHLLVGLLSCIFQLAFVAVYFVDGAKQMDVCSALMWCYFTAFFVTVLTVSFKIKTR